MATKRKATRNDLLGKKPRTKTVEIVLDDEAIDRHDDAITELRKARDRKDKTDVERLTKLVEALDEEVAYAVVSVTLRSIGAKAYDALVDEHPPTKDQLAEAEKERNLKPAFDADTFPVSLITASVIDPVLEREDVETIWQTWNREERFTLWLAALEVNSNARRVEDLGKGSG